MVISEAIKNSLGNWWPVMRELVESNIWDNLYRFLKDEAVNKKKTIIPKSSDTWKSLQLCDRTKVKAIILMQCPYATKRGDVVIADGIPMSCKNIAPYKQPSLYMWDQALEEQYGFDPDNDLRCDLQYLLEEEHVLLINTSLTVELNKVDSHQVQWQPVMQWFIEHVINKYMTGTPIVIVGSQAQKFEKYLNPLSNPILCIEHPAEASYANRSWKHNRMHSWLNNIIKNNNRELEMIQWMRKKGEPKKEAIDSCVLPLWVMNKMDGTPHKECTDLPWSTEPTKQQ